MAFYLFAPNASQWWGGVENTTAAQFNSDYSSKCVGPTATNQPMGTWWKTPLTNVWIHFEMYIDVFSLDTGDTGWLWRVLDDEARTIARLKLVTQGNVDNRLEISDNGSAFTNGSSFGSLPKTILTTVDINVRINDTGNNVIDYYQNGLLVSTVSLAHSVATGIVAFQLSNYDTGGRTYLSEFAVADEDTRGLRFAHLPAAADGALTAWTGGFNQVQERADGQAISSTVNGDRQSFTLGTYGGPASPTAVRGVFVQSIAAAGASGVSRVDQFLRIGSTNYDAAADVAPVSGEPIISEWANDPSTAAPWLTTAFSTLEMGVEAVT